VERKFVDTSVLIAGAGPTGLNLAISLARHGVPFRIVSEAEGPGEHSRAMVVQARTLEFYNQLGFAQKVVDAGVIVDTVHLRRGDGSTPDDIAQVHFQDLARDISPFPFALAYPQDDHERFLLDRLRELGVEVEWQTRLAAFEQDAQAVRATIERKGGSEELRCAWICGCDGAHSRVRESAAIGFPGGTYEQHFFVADVAIEGGFSRDLIINLGDKVLTLLFPVRSSGMQRLIGLVPPELSDRENLRFEEIQHEAERQLNIRVTSCDWFSTYRVHHRVAESFRMGRAFLLGDAGHIHSPAGGQGMNTGIGDAINLGWKLAHVIQRRVTPELLNTYESERIGFARSLVATTDRAFTGIVAGGLTGEFARRIFTPLVLSVATRTAIAQHALFRLISQTRIHYEDSPLSDGRAGHVHGGDRLPWLGPQGPSNFETLRSLAWQVHVYGEPDSAFAGAAERLELPLHSFAWEPRMEAAGFAENSALLIRPDGYVALALPHQEIQKLHAFVERWSLRFPLIQSEAA
jgi:2-polyprenyl-6-methoxyphenol hydroxylase-like FAD-dependent oxidoreductase